MKPLLIFDYDGTLNETMRIYKPAVLKVIKWLKETHGIEVKVPSDKKISSWLGMQTPEMWEDFIPGLPSNIWEEGGRLIGKFMMEGLVNHKARWYGGVSKLLDELKAEGYPMVILSNCDVIYKDTNWREFNLEKWFYKLYDCESYGFIPKTEIISDIILESKSFLPKEYEDKQIDIVVIGDRASDKAAAIAINGKFIGCTYGYGSEEELSGADALVKSPEEIKNKLTELFPSCDY